MSADDAKPSIDIESFIARWAASGAAERANYQSFLKELCDVLGVSHPEPTLPDDSKNAYVFERAVTFINGDGSTSIGRIDLYKRGCFVLEAKQGSDRAVRSALEVAIAPRKSRKGAAVRGTRGWDAAMLGARGQAEQYARALPVSEGWPPFLIVVDVGHSFELYADFTRSGKTYVAFPDPRSHRIMLADLAREDVRERLRLVWKDPLCLDPTRRSAKVTRDVAERLALLARSLETSGHAPKSVADFLMRCLFTMFAEDVELLPKGSFTRLLESLRDDASKFPPLVRSLWQTMNEGGFSMVLRETLLQFDGGLFENPEALVLTGEQIELLVEAAKADWHEVEPAIFGTLLERALDPVERHKLGAHYTPRAYVERLVMPAIIEPLREDWENVRAAAVTHAREGRLDEAIREVRAFHDKLCEIRVLDPACGSGNFLYVTLEHMKRLEGEVLNTLEALGETDPRLELAGHTVDPHQFLGIEVNPRAASIAEMVLWIGFLQWHFRTRGKVAPPQPVLKKFRNIEYRDAVLAWDKIELARDEHGKPISHWDGRTKKIHPVTGEEVPDESARMEVYRYVGARKAEWPKAEFIVGNPPFVGNWLMRGTLGDGYVEALRETYGEVPESSDYVLYWWHKAAELARKKQARRFGLITTNSLPQAFGRRVVEAQLSAEPPLSLVFAIPDHPWVDAADGADVRIAMTVGEAGERPGLLRAVIAEHDNSRDGAIVEFADGVGRIHANLTIGAAVAAATTLKANGGLCCPGVKLHGDGFIVTPEEAETLGLGRVSGLERHIRPYRNGRDITATPRGVMVIDLLGLTEREVCDQYPEIYQWILERVKPERDHNNRASYRENWWIFGEPRKDLRPALEGLKRYIATVETSKHRFFAFLDREILSDNMLVNIALDDAFFLGVLSSRIHVTWALAAGGRLGIGNDPRYNKTRCFDPFPFPVCDGATKARIRDLGERLDSHRKHRQALHPALTMTGMYNVLEKLRAGETLGAREKVIHEQGLVSVLKDIHDELDRATFDAYGWPHTLSDEEILERLVALNGSRAAEERRGIVHWLRPEYQAPKGAVAPTQIGIELGEAIAAVERSRKIAWPKTLPEQAQAVRQALAAASIDAPATPSAVARRFQRARADKIKELLETLAALGHIRQIAPGRYAV